MNLYEGEIDLSDRFISAEALAREIQSRYAGTTLVIGIDGRSGGGKTTLAKDLANRLNASVLSTDDFAWWHSLFDWPEMLIENGIEPLRRGNAVDFRPPAWIEREREGSIVAKPSDFVIVEGVGATQVAMRGALDIGVWVQTDAGVAKHRGLIRDAAERPDPEEAERFWNEWQAAENEFQAQQQSWASADFWLSGQTS